MQHETVDAEADSDGERPVDDDGGRVASREGDAPGEQQHRRPGAGEHAGCELQRFGAKGHSVGREQKQRSRRAKQGGGDEGGRGVQRTNEPGVQDARDKQQQSVDEDGDEVGEGQLVVEGAGLKAAGSEDAALVEHRAVDPGLVQAVAERDEAQLAEGRALFEVDVDGDARNLKPHNPPPAGPAVSPGGMTHYC